MPDAKIRWKPGEREQIAKEVRRFNEKIAREAAKGTANLPPKMNTKSVRESIYSRADFQAFKKLVNNAFKAEAFEQLKSGATQYEQREAAIRIGIINRAKARIRETAPAPEKQQMGTEYYNRLKPRKLKTPKQLKQRYEDYLKSLRAESSGDFQKQLNDTYIDHYLVAARRYIGYPYLQQIEKALRKIPPDAFISAAETTDEFSIKFLYNNMEDSSLGYQVLRAIEKLMDQLNISHKPFYYEPDDLDADLNNTGWEPPED